MVKERGVKKPGRGSRKFEHPGLRFNKLKGELNKNEYECAACHEVFIAAISDEQAIAEAAENFPTVPIEETSIVCEDCFQKMMADVAAHPWAYPPLPPEKK
jgi:hypothetical protein